MWKKIHLSLCERLWSGLMGGDECAFLQHMARAVFVLATVSRVKQFDGYLRTYES
jgi:hypothetical protein